MIRTIIIIYIYVILSMDVGGFFLILGEYN